MTLTAQASAPATQFWRDRGSKSWAAVLPTYWEAGGQPHRQAMLAALRHLPRFETLREIGCCAGTNIRLIREAMPWVNIEGTELSVEAATFAQDKLAQDPNVRVVCADLLLDAPLWEDREVDVTLSVYTLAYVAPENIKDVLAHAIRASERGIVLVEPMHGEPGLIPVTYSAEWRHDYVSILKDVLSLDSRNARIDFNVLPEPVEYCDGAIAVSFS